MSYRPSGMRMWDSWFLEHRGTAHMFYLQRLIEGSRRGKEEDNIGHATSTDLVNWREGNPSVRPGAAGSLEDMQPWTGCAFCPDDEHFYLYYTMRSSLDHGKGQRIGLVRSTDLSEWAHYDANPVIVPDSQYYASHSAPLANGVVDCRDLIIIRDDANARYLGYYAARTNEPDLEASSCIAMIESRDLIHWNHLPPAFAPKRYGCLEVPDVFPLGGHWFLTALTGHWYGNRGIFSDLDVTEGTVYAMAESPEGPFLENVEDNILIAASRHSGYSCRSLVFKGQRYLFYTEKSEDRIDVLTIPKLLRTDGAGHLRAIYSDRYRLLYGARLADPLVPLPILSSPYPNPHWSLPSGFWSLQDGRYRGYAAHGWQIGLLPIETVDMEFECALILTRGVAAGIAFDVATTDTEKPSLEASCVFLDAEEQKVVCADLPSFASTQKRRLMVKPGQAYNLKLVLLGAQIELFIDDVLVLQFGQRPRRGRVGLFVDRGEAVIDALRVTRLIVNPTD
ncbi:MAG: hypothetical protein NTX30_22580 [Deltaproteobacteria bacterium]|nr:hypothetical protein [Deltaproteobacteria bacterium]